MVDGISIIRLVMIIIIVIIVLVFIFRMPDPLTLVKTCCWRDLRLLSQTGNLLTPHQFLFPALSDIQLSMLF